MVGEPAFNLVPMRGDLETLEEYFPRSSFCWGRGTW
jgi:hypothetical protein